MQANLTELKSFGSPPAAVVNVTAAVMVLLSNKSPKIPKDRSWKAAKVMMGKVRIALFSLLHFSLYNFCCLADDKYIQISSSSERT